jgi:hypothetical protein
MGAEANGLLYSFIALPPRTLHSNTLPAICAGVANLAKSPLPGPWVSSHVAGDSPEADDRLLRRLSVEFVRGRGAEPG